MLERKTWTCDFPGCKDVLGAYSESGLHVLRDLHLEGHLRSTRQALMRYDRFVAMLTSADQKFLSDCGIDYFKADIRTDEQVRNERR